MTFRNYDIRKNDMTVWNNDFRNWKKQQQQQQLRINDPPG